MLRTPYSEFANISKCSEYGAKIIFLGGRAGQYTDGEIKLVREAMKKFPIYR